MKTRILSFLFVTLFAVLKLHAACVYSLTGASFPVTGGGGAVSLVTDPGCAWTATADSWIIPSPTSGTGNATVTFTVAANPLSDRTGYLTIGGQNYRVDQAGDVTPPTVSITSPPNGTTYTTAQTVTITATANDNVAVDHVDFYDGGVFKQTDSAMPFTYSWTFTSANNGTHSWTAVAFDANGNNTISVPVELTVNIGASETGPFAWTNSWGGTGQDFGQATAIDPSTGDVLLTGAFSGAVNFGGGVLNLTTGSNILLAKYNTNGVHVWSKGFAGPGSGKGMAVVVDSTGNVYFTGYFVSSVNFGGTFLTSAGGQDIFVCKYNPNGALVWAKRFGSVDNANLLPPVESGLGITVDSSGNPIIVGCFIGTVDFGAGPYVSAGDFAYRDGFILKLAAGTGNWIWSRQIGSTGGNDAVNGVACDGSNVFVTGQFAGSVDFGTGNNLTAQSYDVFVAKYAASNGAYSWAHNYGSTLVDSGIAVAKDAAGDVIVTGTFNGTVNFGGGSLTSAGGKDIFLAKYLGSDGSHVWSRRFGSTSDLESASMVGTDSAKNVWVTGYFSGTADFGDGAKTSAGAWDIFLAKYRPTDGAIVWSKQLGESNIDEGLGLAVDGSGNSVITGRFFNTLDFGGGGKTSAGVGDIFHAKYGP